MTKEYLSEKEAASYACVSYRQFRDKAKEFQLLPFVFMGKKVYRASDLRTAMEKEAEKQHGNNHSKR